VIKDHLQEKAKTSMMFMPGRLLNADSFTYTPPPPKKKKKKKEKKKKARVIAYLSTILFLIISSFCTKLLRHFQFKRNDFNNKALIWCNWKLHDEENKIMYQSEGRRRWPCNCICKPDIKSQQKVNVPPTTCHQVFLINLQPGNTELK